MLVKNGGVYLTTKIEQFPPDIASGRAPRTALGLTKDGHVLLVVVDGRQKHSVGFSLLELALFMQEAGAVDALNLDGGGSSEMVVNGKVVNKPSDGRERRVGDAFVVTANRLAN
jgi:exopolysaccharide biosynthesis protein